MASAGDGLGSTDANGKLTVTGRVQVAHVFSGRGPRRENALAWVWYQSGKRTFAGQDCSRVRSGLGGRYYRYPVRVTTEYTRGSGVIWSGFDPPFTELNPLVVIQLDDSNKASGWYAEMAYFPARWWELNVRFDRLDLLDAESALGRQFNTLTMGAQVFFHPRVRLTANYVFCGVAITSPDAIVDQTVRQNALAVAATMADRVEIRLTSIF